MRVRQPVVRVVLLTPESSEVESGLWAYVCIAVDKLRSFPKERLGGFRIVLERAGTAFELVP